MLFPRRSVGLGVAMGVVAASIGFAVTASADVADPTSADSPALFAADDASIVLNEINYEQITGFNDSVEIYNRGTEAVDLTGWKIRDNHASQRVDDGFIPDGIILAPGEFLVLQQDRDFGFGLGKDEEVYLLDASGTVVDEFAWVRADAPPLGVWARCPDGTGEWAAATEITLGGPNNCEQPVVAGEVWINEVDSQPSDWVEFYNPGTEAFDVSGYEIRDNSDDHRWVFPAGSSIEPGGFLVVEEDSIGLIGGQEGAFREAIGIGSADQIRLYNRDAELVDSTHAWQGHAAIDGDAAAATLARCPDGQGPFVLAYPTPGASNNCVLPQVAVNEIDSQGTPDWAEIVNYGDTAVDISGWTVMDDDPVGHAEQVIPLPEGTILEPGEFFVFNGVDHFTFGLGNGDTVTLRNAQGVTVDEYAYPSHATNFWARCPNGTGDFREVEVATPGSPNNCGNPVRINEVESNGGTPGDWIELVNPTDRLLDISGIEVRDNDDSHSYTIPASTVIPAGGYLVLEEADFGFGLGGNDSVRLFEDGNLIDSTTWNGHAATTWGRCPDVTGLFAVTAESTKGSPNSCVGDIHASPWPGSTEVRIVDNVPTFLEDSSGLDFQETADGTYLWAVDNGTGKFWKLNAHADGSVTFVDGWEDGKRARFIKDADDERAAGPDAEGITVADDGFVYIASERDNNAKGVNYNVILQVDPEAPGPDVVATQEWDLTESLPQVGANLGIEAVEWISDDVLEGTLYDVNTSAPYNPNDYPGHGNGLFFVAVEDNGVIYGYALYADGTFDLVSETASGLPGVMALDYDQVTGVLWAVCDDGCDGRSAQLVFNGSAEPQATYVERPGGMPNINNEGFATATNALSVDGERPVWWFADGYTSGSLRTGTLPGTDPGDDDDDDLPGDFEPLPGSDLTEENRGGIEINPASARPGDKVSISGLSGIEQESISVWLYSEPQEIGAGTVSTTGSFDVIIPETTAIGAHRIAVYSVDGDLVGWAPLTVVSATGTDGDDSGDSDGSAGGTDDADAGSGLPVTGADLAALALLIALFIGLGGAILLTRKVAVHRN